MLPALRDYQQQAIASLREEIAKANRRLVLVAPTGAGKSVIAHAIVAHAREKGTKVLFVVNRVQLVQQFSERLMEAGIEHGILRGSDSRREYMPVLVGSIQTVARRGLPDQFQLIVIDEAHAVPGSKDYRKLIASHKDAVILGLTATPWAKGMAQFDPDLGGPLFHKAVVAARYSDLLAAGHLVDCTCYAPSEPDLTGVKTKRDQFGGTDYVETDLERAVNKPTLIGDIVTHWKELANGTPTVVFATSIAHSKAIVEAFVAAGVRAEHIDAYCEHDERKRILGRVDRGETTVISCAALLAEGWDQPSIKTLVLARPTKSMIRYVQMVGRVLRPFPGKDRALVLDHSGTVLRLGYPTMDREYELDDGKPRVQYGFEKTGELPPSRCPKCGFVDPHRANPCEACGFQRKAPSKVRTLSGKLVELKKPVTKEDKERFYRELLYIQRDRKYKDGWVAWKYKEKFGVWPRVKTSTALVPSPETINWVKSRDIKYAHRRRR